MNLNKQLLMGRLGRDPEVRYTQSGKPVATLNVATNYYVPVQGAEKPEEHTVWHKVVVWGDRVETYISKFKKGDLVYVEGETREDEWEDKEGNKRRNKYVLAGVVRGIFLGKNGDKVSENGAVSKNRSNNSEEKEYSQSVAEEKERGSAPPVDEDDLPF